MTKNALLLSLIFILISCIDIDDKRFGTYGVSETKSQSRSKDLYQATYIPERFTFRLLDNSLIQIDTAWAELPWTYGKDAVPIVKKSSGYRIIIPIKKQEFEKFIFIFSLADSNNRHSTNGIEPDRCVVWPKTLKDTIAILLEEKSPDTLYGWRKSVITDTTKFVKQ
jgi:hypothetical protein